MFSRGVCREAGGWFVNVQCLYSAVVLLFFSVCESERQEVGLRAVETPLNSEAILSKSCSQFSFSLSLYVLYLSFPSLHLLSSSTLSLPPSLLLVFFVTLPPSTNHPCSSNVMNGELNNVTIKTCRYVHRQQQWVLHSVHCGCVKKLQAPAHKRQSENILHSIWS